jgi:UDPglucose--hexose-1-phosphate uridylyltransferase
MSDLNAEQRAALSDVLKGMTMRYDRLFEISFPYSMGFHQRPIDGQAHPEWHFSRTLLSAAAAFGNRP